MPLLVDEPLAYRPADAARKIGLSLSSLERCQRAGWIKPRVHSRKLTLFRADDVRLLLERIEKNGGLPPDEKSKR